MTATKQPSGSSSGSGPQPVNRKARRTSFPLVDLYGTAVGKKWVMAITGIALMGFVFAHMFGNLKLYQGQADIDAYGVGLKTLGYPLLPKGMVVWGMRAGLLLVFVAHIHSAYSLTLMNRRANPTSYSRRDYIAVSFAARTMRYTGVIVAAFLVYHLADFTWGWAFVNPDYAYGDIHDNVVASFSRIPVAILYVVANLALGVHLYHGSWSIFQSLGSMSPRFNPRRNPLRKGFALAFTLAVIVPNISFPLAVQFGIIG